MFVFGLGHRIFGRIARTNAFEVMFRVVMMLMMLMMLILM